MPIQIVDNFDLSSAKPIDNRLVVGPGLFYPNRASITNLYPGLRVWDFDNSTITGLGFVWTGTAWVSENTTSVGGGGVVGRLPYWNTTTTIIESGIRYDSSSENVGIGIAAESGVSSARLVVSGNIKSSGGVFVGSAWNGTTGITNINATNIATGTMNITRLQGSSNVGWLLTSDSSTSVSYKNPSTINVGSATQLQNTRTLWGQSFNGLSNVTGNITVGGSITNITGSIQFRNSASPIPGVLSISWLGTTNINKSLYIPSWNGVSRTLSLLEQTQTFTGQNTFDSFTFLNNNIQVTGTSSFKDELEVDVTGVLNFPAPIGPVSITTKPLKVEFDGIKVGSNTGNPYISLSNNAYTFNGDTDTGMFRVSTSGSTMSSLRFLNDNMLQMVVGNNISATYSTLVERYSTPGISMMSVLDIWYVDFTTATTIIPVNYWLDSANNVPYTSLPTTPYGNNNGTNNASTNYDRIVVINTEGKNTATVWIETAPLSNVFWQAGSIFTDSSYTLIIPAGRRWRVSMNVIGGETVSDGALDVSPAAVANDRSAGTYVRFMSYKFGMN